MARSKEAALTMQEELRVREISVVEQHRILHGNQGVVADYSAIVADRLTRWAPVVAAIDVPEELLKWAAMMTSVYGPEVILHRSNSLPGYRTDWITALLVVRYGESEYFWPEAFEKDDLRRAGTWLRGKKPAMITYIPKQEG